MDFLFLSLLGFINLELLHYVPMIYFFKIILHANTSLICVDEIRILVIGAFEFSKVSDWSIDYLQ